MECSQKWLDVFVTNADPKQETDYDDRYVAPVQSVWVHSIPGVTVDSHTLGPHPMPGLLIGTIVEEQTDWIMPTFPQSHGSDPFKEIMVGDLIRVGAPSTSGFTDYLTVVEKQHIAAMANGTGVPLPLHKDGPSTGYDNIPPYDSYDDVSYAGHVVSNSTGLRGGPSTGGDSIAYEMTALRVNHAVNCTSINRPKDDDILKHFVNTPVAIRYYTVADVMTAKLQMYTEVSAAMGDSMFTDSMFTPEFEAYFLGNGGIAVTDYHPMSPHFTQANKASLTDRHLVHAWGPPKNVGEKPEHHPLYPMYHMREWRATYGQLTAELDHGVKEIQQFKLVGYSLINKRQVGPQHAHEMIQDDYLILRIKEVDGKVISNNRHANGAFAVLYAGAHGDNDKGGADVHKFDPDGLVVQHMSTTNKIMRNLTVQVTDRTGQPAHFGRLHLWFKILATHG